MSETRPLVSVLMPVYNAAPFVAQAIQSILDQTFDNFELLIVDGSTDDTPTIIEVFARKDARIRRLVQSDRGIVPALNQGIAAARGTYIARMDADDVSVRARLAKQVEYLESHIDVGVLGTGARMTDSDGAPLQSLRFPSEHWMLRWSMCFYSPIIHPSVMMRKQPLVAAGGYDSRMRYGEDYELWRRLSLVTRLANLPDELLYLRKHAENLSERHPSDARRFSLEVSSAVMSDILSEPVPAEEVQRAWSGARSRSDAVGLARLVFRLYRSIIRAHGMSDGERTLIRRDAAHRLYELSRPWMTHVASWRNLVRAYYLDSSLLTGPLRRRWSMRQA